MAKRFARYVLFAGAIGLSLAFTRSATSGNDDASVGSKIDPLFARWNTTTPGFTVGVIRDAIIPGCSHVVLDCNPDMVIAIVAAFLK